MSNLQRALAPLVVTFTEDHQALCRAGGMKHVLLANHPSAILTQDGELQPNVAFFGSYVILIPEAWEHIRDEAAIRLGDEVCRWGYLPDKAEDVAGRVGAARPMWTDEIATMQDIPDVGPEKTYKSGFDALDRHGFRIVLPAFMAMIGPYGSGKSVFLRQLLVHLWRLHQWKFLITSFEEKIKPRYQRDLRRHLIGRPMCNERGEILWSAVDIAKADAELERCVVFLRRKRKTILDLDRLLDRLEFAVRVHGVKVIGIDPVNEVDHIVPKGESKTDYMGRFIMALKALADDYDLLVICLAHPPKDSVEKRLSKKAGLLTMNDGADTAHWGNKPDIGFCLWRNIDGPTYLHGDKLKDHETMGQPFLAEMRLDPTMNRFNITRMGYDVLQHDKE